jgi:aspartokinase-like uncharacterized kinase
MGREVAVHVVKIGGSLLTRDDFAPAIRAWVGQQFEAESGTHVILLVGGGPLVDALREVDRLTPSDQTLVHWMAIELMEMTGKLVGDWMVKWPVESSLEGLRARCLGPGVTLFRPLDFLRHQEPRLEGTRLPVGWQVTSDSIAARLAEVLGAERLTLLKSQLPPEGSWSDWGAQGYVDEHFARAASTLRQVSAELLPNSVALGVEKRGLGMP